MVAVETLHCSFQDEHVNISLQWCSLSVKIGVSTQLCPEVTPTAELGDHVQRMFLREANFSTSTEE